MTSSRRWRCLTGSSRISKIGIEILAHRANIDGTQRDRENSLSACERALKAGYGLEIDLRRSAEGAFYLSHDPAAVSVDNQLSAFARLFRMYPECTIAVNVKELGYEEDLILMQHDGVFGNRSYYFDFELLESPITVQTQRRMRLLSGGATVRLAARLSDRGESLERCLSMPAEIAWADEFDGNWLQASDIERLRDAGRRVYVVSPELHGRDNAARYQRWADFKTWNVDGLCTDYAREASTFFN